MTEGESMTVLPARLVSADGLAGLLHPGAILPDLKVASKAKALLHLATRAAGLTGIDAGHVYATLIEREQLGSTGIGRGVAIPHGRLEGLSWPCLVFARLSVPIGFEAVDEEPVDLLALLLSPQQDNSEHLKGLSRICRLIHDPALCRRLRDATSAERLCALLVEALAV